MRISDWSSDVCSSDLAHDPDISVRNLHQRDWNAFQPCTMQSVLSGYPVQDLTLTDQPCLAGGETKSRDVVQPCLKRQDYVFKGAAFTAFPQFVQRNRLIKCDWASRSEEHTSELTSLMRISYAVFCLKKNK